MTFLLNAAYEAQQVVFDHDLIIRYDEKGSRYTSYPTADRFSSQFGAAEYEHILCQQAPGATFKPLSLSFHIPFCNSVCYYCACNKVITEDRSLADTYLGYLIQEINLQADCLPYRPKVSQLHFGGGTPTFLSDTQFECLISAIQSRFDLLPCGEYSIEIDPRKVSSKTVQLLRRLGFNRMNVGLQDFNVEVQKAVNRIQGYEETSRVIEDARACGFSSISLGLMYGLPLQTADSVYETIDQVLTLRPDQVSFYNYAHLPEEFIPQQRIQPEYLPAPQVKRDILRNTIRQLTDAGYVFIGMDHFALPDDELATAQRRGRLHRNFQGYSTHADCDLMAFGVSAIGKIGPTYCQNVKTLDDYYSIIDSGQLPVDRGLSLRHDDLLRRTIIHSLMCQFEMNFQPVEISYLINFREYFADELYDLAAMEEDGLLRIDADRILILPRGRILVRSIAMVFDRYLRVKHSDVGYSRLI